MNVRTRRSRFWSLIVATLAAGLFSQAVNADPFFRAFWADAFHTGYKSTTDINNLVSRAVTGNYNAIIVEVMAYQDRGVSGHGAYWNSSIVPKATDIQSGLDPLSYLVSRAHTYGIEVHAWIVPYRVSTTWPPSGNSLVSAHPEWLMVPSGDMGGGTAKIDGKYVLDPGSPEVQEYIASIVNEIVTDYAVDGINLDYIRYTSTDAGYPAYTWYERSSLARFQDLTGYVGTPPTSGDSDWNDFRRQTITELVRRLRAEIPSITTNPRQPVRLTADLYATGGAPSSFSSSQAYTLFQNWRYWMERGYLDAGVPMNYKREWESPQDIWYRDWIDAAVGWRYSRQMFCGQANYLNPKADSVTQLLYAINAGADGISNYSYFGTADENMDDNWETDWTWYSYVAANVFTSAVDTPAMPWRDPNTATEGTLWGRVADPSTDEPIDGAIVQVGGGTQWQADGNGIYVVTLLPAASGGTTYTVTASMPGCSTVHVYDVNVLPGDVVRQDIGLCPSITEAGDMNEDGLVNWIDFTWFNLCLSGPGSTYNSSHFCLNGDADYDSDDDMADFANFQQIFGE
ncbi:MAG: family 10 glycosylhydrolase [Phycisphaerae bacterium]|nr:family 10 glycosylhydrolase [Phycisphaerae bacterium]